MPSASSSSSSSASSSSSSSTTSGPHRTVAISSQNQSSTTISSKNTLEKKKSPSINHIASLGNINTNNNNNNDLVTYFIEQKRSSRAPIQIIEQDFGTLNHHHRRARARSQQILYPKCDDSAFRIVHQPIINQQQQQQYTALLKILKTQELQVEQQEKELGEKQKGLSFFFFHEKIQKKIFFYFRN